MEQKNKQMKNILFSGDFKIEDVKLSSEINIGNYESTTYEIQSVQLNLVPLAVIRYPIASKHSTYR